MRLLLEDTTAITVGRTPAQADRGGRYSEQRRDRRGAPAYFTFETGFRAANPYQIMSPDDRYKIYKYVPDIRAAVDRVVLQIATWNWTVDPAVPEDDASFDRAQLLAEETKGRLDQPNAEDDWYAFCSRIVGDLLRDDALAVEHVADGRGQLQELVAWRGGDVAPVQDRHGRTLRYDQMSSGNPTTASFLPDQLTYANLFPNTSVSGGTPLIETLIEEAIILRAWAVRTRKMMDADEIPEGWLILTGMSEEGVKRLEEKSRNQAGEQQKLKVIWGPASSGLAAKWEQAKRSSKDEELIKQAEAAQRKVWRTFHVKPVSMGETENTPRASAEVQLEIEDLGLIQPILEMIERLVNGRWLPLLVKNPALAQLVRFSFDWDHDLSQEDQKTAAERHTAYLGAKVLTINEVRKDLGLDPVSWGDGDEEEPDPSDQEDEEAPEEDEEDEDEAGRGRAHAHSRTCRHTHALALPSAWQPKGKFRGRRTLDLKSLGDAIEGYSEDVHPLYQRARLDVLKAAEEATRDGKLSSAEVARVAGAIGRATEELERDWTRETRPRYRVAARIGAQAAARFEDSVADEQLWTQAATTYQGRAMGYLREAGGLISDLRAQLTDLLMRTSTTLSRRGVRAAEENAWVGLFLSQIRAIFDRHEHRIENWSGRLVELSNLTLRSQLRVIRAENVEQPERADAWYVQWADAKDANECPTCIYEAGKGFQPLSRLARMPGGDTECMARDRCVLVYWRKKEIDSGEAVLL